MMMKMNFFQKILAFCSAATFQTTQSQLKVENITIRRRWCLCDDLANSEQDRIQNYRSLYSSKLNPGKGNFIMRQICMYVEVSKEEYENGFNVQQVLDEMKAGTRGFSIEDDGVDYDDEDNTQQCRGLRCSALTTRKRRFTMDEGLTFTLPLPERFLRFVNFLYKDRPETRERVYNRMMKNLASVNLTNPNPKDLTIGTETRLSGKIDDISWFFSMIDTVYKKEQEIEEIQRKKSEDQSFIDSLSE